MSITLDHLPLDFNGRHSLQFHSQCALLPSESHQKSVTLINKASGKFCKFIKLLKFYNTFSVLAKEVILVVRSSFGKVQLWLKLEFMQVVAPQLVALSTQPQEFLHSSTGLRQEESESEHKMLMNFLYEIKKLQS